MSSASIKKAIEKLTAKDQDKKRPLAGAGAGRPGAGLPFFSGSDASQQKGGGTDTLKQFATNLTQKARDGKLDPVIGREKEVQRMMEILSRRTKNNPLILGDPGVGKTAIVEGLAQQIAAGNVPENLMNQNIWTLDLPGLVRVPSIAASLRSASERDPRGHRSRRRHPVYRRDAHHHRCRFC